MFGMDATYEWLDNIRGIAEGLKNYGGIVSF